MESSGDRREVGAKLIMGCCISERLEPFYRLFPVDITRLRTCSIVGTHIPASLPPLLLGFLGGVGRRARCHVLPDRMPVALRSPRQGWEGEEKGWPLLLPFHIDGS